MNTEQEDIIQAYATDWISLLQEVAKLSDAMGLDDGDWAEADNDTLIQEFDPWYVIELAVKFFRDDDGEDDSPAA